MKAKTILPLLLQAITTATFDLPSSLDTIYNTLTSSDTKCKNYIDGNQRLYDGHDNKGWGFCRDFPGAVYLKGPGRKLGDMDVDCAYRSCDICGPGGDVDCG